MPDKIKLLYDAVSKSYDVGSFDEFANKLQDPTKRKAFYDGIGNEFSLGDYNEFSTKVSKKDIASDSGNGLPRFDGGTPAVPNSPQNTLAPAILSPEEQQKYVQRNEDKIATNQRINKAKQIGEVHAEAPEPNPEKGFWNNVAQGAYLPSFNKGFNDLVVKPLAGATDFVDRSIDKIYEGVTGEKTPEWLRKSGKFDKIAKHYDQEFEKRDKPTNIASEVVEGTIGTLPLMASLYTGQGEATLATKAPELITSLTKTLALTGGLNAYKDATDQGKDYVSSLVEAQKGAGEGAKSGLELEAQMMLGGALGKGVVKALAEKGLLKGGKAAEAILHAMGVGTIFGGTSAGSDLMAGKDIDTHEAAKQFGMGLAFEMPGIVKGIDAEYKAGKINDKAAQQAAIAGSAANLNAESVLRTLNNTDAETLTAINESIKESKDDLYAKSIEAGAKAYEAKDLGDKRQFYTNQLALKTQADVKLLSDWFSKDPEGITEEIMNSHELEPAEKQDMLDKLNTLVKPEPNEQPIESPIIENEVQQEPSGEPTPADSPAIDEVNTELENVDLANEVDIPEEVQREPDIQVQRMSYEEPETNSKWLQSLGDGITIIEPTKPISEMNRQEMYEYEEKVRKALKEQDKLFSGKTEQEKEIGGYYDYIDNTEDLRDTANRIGFIEEAKSLDDLSSSFKSNLKEIEKNTDYGKALSLAIIKRSQELNISPEDLFKSVVKRVGDQYKDVSDAEYMMRNTIERLLPTDNKETTSSPKNKLIESKDEPEKNTVETKSSDEVLVKADTDLESLKQSKDKPKKYEASMARLTDAKKSGAITTKEFDTYKEKFDQVIGESDKKVGDALRKLADKVDAGKISKLGGFKAGTGFDAVWDGSLTVVSKSLRTGAKIADAIEEGLKHIRESDWYKGLKDKKKFEDTYRDHMTSELKEKSKKDSEDSDKEKPTKKEKKETKFTELAHKNIQSEEISNTLNNVERETGRQLTADEKEYNITRRDDALRHGADVVDAAKTEFGKDYVGELLDYLSENSKTLPIENKALITISLELDLERQLKEDPNNVGLNKKLKLVRDISTKQQRSAAIATGYGILRQIARVGYDLNQVTDNFFSDNQLEAKKKIQKAVESTPDDINKEAETQEQETKPVKPNGAKLVVARENVKKAKAEFDQFIKKSRTQAGAFADVAGFVKAASKLIKAYGELGIVKIEDVLDQMRKDYGEDFVKENEDNLVKAHESVSSESKDKKDIVKKALIDAGYGREITVTTKKGKEKRNVLDWKKLTGAEGDLENINEVIDATLKDKGYTSKEIDEAKKALKDEYNALHASIIEKSINELNRRNADKEPYNSKDNAQRLAELYNFGLFDKETDTYDNLINSAVGLSGLEQSAFNEAKELARAMATVYSTRGKDGRRMSDIAVKKAITDLQSQQEQLLTKVANANSTRLYKVVNAAGEFISLGQRFVLASLNQVIENPLAGFTERGMLDAGDKITGTGTTSELRKQRTKLAKSQFMDILYNGGNDFGNVKSPFLIKSQILDKINSLSDKKWYQAMTADILGRSYLEGADSMHKIALTQRAFTTNLIKILQAKGMKREDAVNAVSTALTGQSFEDAKQTSKELITTVNDQAGKKLLSDKEESITLLANDIVKNALIEGGLVNDHELKSAYKSAYKVAGLGMGHEPNNFISRGIKNVNQEIEGQLTKSIKNKEWGEAAAYKMQNILYNNILNPFVGGGMNWSVLTATKMGVNPFGYINLLRKQAKIDPTTVTGQRQLQENLTKIASRRNDVARTLAGAAIGLTMYAITRSTDKDEDLEEWLKNNKWARGYFGKLTPPVLGLIMASDAKSTGEDESYKNWWATTFGVKEVNYFDDAKKVAKAVNIISPKDQSEYDEAMGALGQLTLGKINAPAPSWKVVKQFQDIYRGLHGQPPVGSDYKVSGFLNGAFQGGLTEYMGLRPSANVAAYDESGKEVPLRGKEKVRYENMVNLSVASEIEAKEKDLAKLDPAKRQSEIKKITTSVKETVLGIISGANDQTLSIEVDGKPKKLTSKQISERIKLNKEFRDNYEKDMRSGLEESGKSPAEINKMILNEANKYSKSLMIEKYPEEFGSAE